MAPSREEQAGQETGKEFHLLNCLADWMSRRMHGAAQVFLISEAGKLNPKRTSHIEGSELKREVTEQQNLNTNLLGTED